MTSAARAARTTRWRATEPKATTARCAARAIATSARFAAARAARCAGTPAPTWLATLGIVLVVLALVAYYTYLQVLNIAPREYTGTVQKMLFSHLQMLGILGIFRAKGTAVFNAVVNRPAEIIGGKITSLLPLKCAMGSQSYGPFLLNMALPLVAPLVIAALLVPMTLVQRNAHANRKAQPMPVFKGRFGIPRALACCALLRTPMTEADQASFAVPFDPRARFAGVMVFVLFTLYPTLVASIASIMNCTVPIGGIRYLVADLTVQCHDGWHIAFLFLAVLFSALYSVGIPIGIGVVTVVHCGKDADDEDDDEDSDEGDEGEGDDGEEAEGEGEGGDDEVDAEDEDSDECEEEGDEGDQEADGEDEGGDDEEGARRRSDTAAAAAAGDRAEGGEAEISDDANGERTDDEGSAASVARLDLEDDRGDGAVRARVAQRSCRRHTAADYRSHRVRTRFAFLFAGYATDRSGLVVAWEMFVMLQKLAVTLAGSSVTDVRCSARAPPPARAPSLVLTLLLCLPTLVLSFAPPCTAFVLRSRTSRF